MTHGVGRLTVAVTGLLALAATSPWARADDLAQAWQAALAADRQVRAAAEVTRAAEQQLSAARGAQWPRLTVEGGYTVLDHAPATLIEIPPFPPQELPTAQDQSLSYRGTLSVPLYTGGRITSGIDAATAGVSAAHADAARTALDLKLAVAEVYVAVLRAQRGVELAEKNVESLAAHADDVANRFHQGLVAKNDLLAAQVALADARSRAIRAHAALDAARSAYNRRLGRGLTAPVALAALEPQALEGDVDALTARALRQRPELAGLGAQGEQLRHESRRERAAALPQVSLSGGYRYDENRYQLYEGIWAATLGVRWELFDGGIARHQAEAIAARAAAAREARDDLASQIALQVRQAWLEVNETRERLAVTQDAVAQSEENLNVARSRYRAGLATNTVVLDAEAQRTLSYSNHDNARYDAVLAGLRLRYATGDLLAADDEMLKETSLDSFDRHTISEGRNPEGYPKPLDSGLRRNDEKVEGTDTQSFPDAGATP